MKNKQTNVLVRFLLINFVHADVFTSVASSFLLSLHFPAQNITCLCRQLSKKRKIGEKNHDIFRFLLAQNAHISLFSSEQVLLVFLFIGSFSCY